MGNICNIFDKNNIIYNDDELFFNNANHYIINLHELPGNISLEQIILCNNIEELDLITTNATILNETHQVNNSLRSNIFTDIIGSHSLNEQQIY